MGESDKNIINMVDTSENINININSSNNSGYKCKHKGIKQIVSVLKEGVKSMSMSMSMDMGMGRHRLMVDYV